MPISETSQGQQDQLFQHLQQREQTISDARSAAVANPGLAVQLTDVQQQAPAAPAGVKLSAAQAIVAGVVTRENALQAALVAGLHKRSGWDRVAWDINPFNVAKGFVRTNLAALQSGAQLVAQAGTPLAQAVGYGGSTSRLAGISANEPAVPQQVQGGENPSFSNFIGGTTVGKSLQDIVAGRNPDLGQGFFPAGLVEKQRTEAARQFRGTIAGTNQTATIGRALASIVADPNGSSVALGDLPIVGPAMKALVTQPLLAGGLVSLGDIPVIGPVMTHMLQEKGANAYNWLSGGIDGYIANYGDPASHALEALSAVRESSQLFEAARAVSRGEIAASIAQEGRKLVEHPRFGLGAYTAPATVARDAGGVAVRAKRTFVPYDDLVAQYRAAGLAKLRDDAGILDGVRATFQPKRSEAFMTQDRRGVALGQALADSKDFDTTWKLLGKRVDPSMVLDFMKADTVPKVNELLYGLLGSDIRSVNQLVKRVKMPTWMSQSRLMQSDFAQALGEMSQRYTHDVPDIHFKGLIDGTPLQRTLNMQNMENTLVNVKTITPAERSGMMKNFAVAMSAVGTDQNRFNVQRNTLRLIGKALEGHGYDAEVVKRLTTWRDSEDISRFAHTAEGFPTDFMKLNVTPDAVITDPVTGKLTMNFSADQALTEEYRNIGPHLLSEGMADSITMPDPRKIRRLLSPLSFILASQSGERVGELRRGWAAIEWTQSAVWKMAALMRAAFVLRIVGDEQVRMANSGMASAFRDPTEWMQWAMAHDATGAFDLYGNDFARLGEFAASSHSWDPMLEGMHTALNHPGGVGVAGEPLAGEKRAFFTGGYDLVHKAAHPQKWVIGHGEELRQLYNDPLAAKVADGWSNQELANYLHSAGGAPSFRELLSRGENTHETDMVSGGERWVQRDYNNPAVLNDYLESIRERLHVATGDDPKLMRLVASGYLPTDETVALRGDDYRVLNPGENLVRTNPLAAQSKEQQLSMLGPAGKSSQVVPQPPSALPPGPTAYRTGPTTLYEEGPSNKIGSEIRLNDGRRATIINQAPGDTVIARLDTNAFDRTGETTQAARDASEAYRTSPNAPPVVKYRRRAGESLDGVRQPIVAELEKARQTVARFFFHSLYGKTSDYLSRSVAYRQLFWKRAAELTPQLAPDQANQMLKNLQGAAARYTNGDVKAFLQSDKAVGDVVERAKLANGSLTWEHADAAAKSYALEELNHLLYSASKRNQFFDIARVVVPFGEAWKEVLTSWGRIMYRQPRVLRRAQLLVQGGRDFDPDGDGQGFVHTDPTTGREVFSYPYSAEVTRFLTADNPITRAMSHVPIFGGRFSDITPGAPGVAADIAVPIQGMNIGAQIMPSIGPVMSIPVSILFHDKPQFDFARSFLLPYGETSVGKEFGLPSWLEKVRSGLVDSPESTKIYGDTVARIVQVNAASGKYGTSTEEQTRLWNDSKAQARAITVIRGLAQFGGVAAPTIDFSSPTIQGKMPASVLIKAYNQLRADNANTALERFQQLYGEDATAFAVSTTKTTVGGLDASKAFGQFEVQNQGLFDSHPNVAGYFAPTSAEFDFNVYDRQLKSGKRKRLTPPQYTAALNQTVANEQYYAVRDAVLAANAKTGRATLNDQQRLALAQYKAGLDEQYPVTAAERTQPPDQVEFMRDLKHALADPRLAGNDVATAASRYVALHDLMTTAAQKAGTTLSSAQSVGMREVLFQAGQNLARETPGFARMWERQLAFEVSGEQQG